MKILKSKSIQKKIITNVVCINLYSFLISNNLAGDLSEMDTPVPIPNTMVKDLYGDGTGFIRESSMLPAFFLSVCRISDIRFFYLNSSAHSAIL